MWLERSSCTPDFNWNQRFPKVCHGSLKFSITQHKTEWKIIVCLKISVACDELLLVAGIAKLLVCLQSFYFNCMETVYMLGWPLRYHLWEDGATCVLLGPDYRLTAHNLKLRTEKKQNCSLNILCNVISFSTFLKLS